LDKISALAISDTILDKTEKCDGRFIRINHVRRFIRAGIKIIELAWYNLFGLRHDGSINVIKNGRTHNSVFTAFTLALCEFFCLFSSKKLE